MSSSAFRIKPTREGLPSTPWYREPWPWLLMAGPLAVIVAGAATAWLAVRSYDGLIADDYYKQGLAVNQVLARGREAAKRGIEGTLEIRPGVDGAFEVHVQSTAGELPAAVHVVISHPTRAGMDQRLRAVRVSAQGSYAGRMEPLARGRWNVSVEDGTGQWRIRGELRAAAMQEAPLKPAQ